MNIELFVDLDTIDDTGLPWSYVDQAQDPSSIVVGRRLVVGAGNAVAIAEVVSVAVDGLVHVRPFAGPVTPARLDAMTSNR